MKCNCANLSVRNSGYAEDNYFKNLHVLKEVTDGWRSIMKCSECNQLWLVDHFDKLQSLFAYKIDSMELPTDGEFFQIHKNELEKLKGGYSKEKCMYKTCNIELLIMFNLLDLPLFSQALDSSNSQLHRAPVFMKQFTPSTLS